MIFYLDEQSKINYAWGLGTLFNNHAEFLALWKGLEIALDRGIKKLMVLGVGECN